LPWGKTRTTESSIIVFLNRKQASGLSRKGVGSIFFHLICSRSSQGSGKILKINRPMFSLFSIVIFVLDILAIIEVLKSSKSSGDKILWVLVICLLPIVGLLLYYFIGKK
jgi:hypothetical protein